MTYEELLQSIPIWCLVSSKCPNLMVAGRSGPLKILERHAILYLITPALIAKKYSSSAGVDIAEQVIRGPQGHVMAQWSDGTTPDQWHPRTPFTAFKQGPGSWTHVYDPFNPKDLVLYTDLLTNIGRLWMAGKAPLNVY